MSPSLPDFNHRETRLTVDFCSFCYLVIYSIFVLNQPPVIFRDSIVLRSELPLPRSEGMETAKERAKRGQKNAKEREAKERRRKRQGTKHRRSRLLLFRHFDQNEREVIKTCIAR